MKQPSFERCTGRMQRTGQEEAVIEVWLKQWPEVASSLVAAQTSVVIGKKEKYAFNGKKLKPGTYQITSYSTNPAEIERELEAQNAFESMKKVTTANGWYYMGEIKSEDMTKKLVCSKHGQAYVMIEGCPWCE